MDWKRALKDPSLMKLGDWLTRQVCEHKLAELEEGGMTRRRMEEKFLKEESIKSVIMVEGPDNVAHPFIRLWKSEVPIKQEKGQVHFNNINNMSRFDLLYFLNISKFYFMGTLQMILCELLQ